TRRSPWSRSACRSAASPPQRWSGRGDRRSRARRSPPSRSPGARAPRRARPRRTRPLRRRTRRLPRPPLRARTPAPPSPERAQRWQDLDDCASELATLGASGKAEELRATARQEIQNQLLDGQARSALRSGNLQQARAALQQIDPGSLYLAPLRDAFAAAEQ